MMRLRLRHWRNAGPGVSPASAALLLVSALIGAFAMGAAAEAAETGVTLSDPWMRFIVPSRPAAGYFVLTNDTALAHALIGAASPACGTLMLHKSMSKNGVEKMMIMDRIAIPAHGKLTFAPGGYHLMCMRPTAAVKPGKSVVITLRFADGGTLVAPFPVRGVSDK
jgi:periplasmic copper chaperone A